MRKEFSNYHPANNFIFFACAIIYGMFISDPIFLAITDICATMYLVAIKRWESIKLIIGMIVVLLAIAVINPIFNTNGETVIFLYFGRPYTLEALKYGFVTGAMFYSVILWFVCYNEIMTSDKFIYLFGKIMPSMSLVFTMVLRFVPLLKMRIERITTARSVIGKTGITKKEKYQNSSTVLLALTGSSLENGAICADSMKGRGYGLEGRSSYAIYRLTNRDLLTLLVLLICNIGVIYGIASGDVMIGYNAESELNVTLATLIGMISYLFMLFIPTFLQVKEELIWHISRSKI